MIKDASIYKKVDVHSKVDSASPTRLVQLLYENALENLRKSKSCLAQTEEGTTAGPLFNQHLVKTMDTILALREALNFDVESDLPHNLDGLYDYLQRRLLSARVSQSPKDADAVVEECIALMETLKSGWDSLCH